MNPIFSNAIINKFATKLKKRNIVEQRINGRSIKSNINEIEFMATVTRDKYAQQQFSKDGIRNVNAIKILTTKDIILNLQDQIFYENKWFEIKGNDNAHGVYGYNVYFADDQLSRKSSQIINKNQGENVGDIKEVLINKIEFE